jgi:hypothetical protein
LQDVRKTLGPPQQYWQIFFLLSRQPLACMMASTSSVCVCVCVCAVFTLLHVLIISLQTLLSWVGVRACVCLCGLRITYITTHYLYYYLHYLAGSSGTAAHIWHPQVQSRLERKKGKQTSKAQASTFFLRFFKAKTKNKGKLKCAGKCS